MAKSTISPGPYFEKRHVAVWPLVTFSRLQLAEISRWSNEMGAWKLRSSLVTWLVTGNHGIL